MKRFVWPLAVFLLSLTVYSLCLQPGVGFTDAGELAGACRSLGVAHPTGYPLFVLLGFVWSYLPLPLSIIAKLNYFAATCTALSASAFYVLLREVLLSVHESESKASAAPQAARMKNTTERGASSKKSHRGSVERNVTASVAVHQSPALSSQSKMTIDVLSTAMALCYAFAQTVWSQAESIEVYSLHLLLLCSALALVFKAVRSTDRRWLWAGACAVGLSFSNHLTTILIIVPVVVLFFYRPAEGFVFDRSRRKDFLKLLGIVMCFALLYGTLVLNSMHQPWFNWGAVHRGWDTFSYHVFGKQYSVWMFSDEAGVAAKQFRVFRHLLPNNLAWVGLLLAPFGLWTLSRTRMLRPVGLFLSLLVVCGVGYSVNYNIHDIDSYFLSAYVALLVFCGVGLYALLRHRKGFVYAAFILPLIALSINWHTCDEHENVLVENYVRMMVDPLPKNAVLFSQQWDYFCSAFWYMQQVEGYRPDVVLVEKELLRRTWYPTQLERWYPWAIQSCQPEIDAYLADLKVFEDDAEAFQQDASRVRSIQSKFIALLNAVVHKNINQRPLFATREVFEGEKGFASDMFIQPYGLCLNLSQDSVRLQADTASIAVQAFENAHARHHEEHLEIAIAQTASDALTANVVPLAQSGRLSEAEWFCRHALILDPHNSTAHKYSEQLSIMRSQQPKP